ncbi:MAG: hypothetical protein DWQ04_19095 [Chloroflexi bacterium]|nr:MAG: hypothetical protein DWQ04_19095 [Chloroflexota bacterium]
MRKWVWDGKPWMAFKTFAIIFSFITNIVLILVLLIAAPLILPIVNDIVNPIVGGLNNSFVDMGDANISRTIEVNDTIPINFTLPLETETAVVLVDNVSLAGVPTTFNLPGGGGTINGAVNLVLPKGLVLPVELSLDVPVDQQIDIALNVDVDIPLDETELGSPFNQLQSLFGPLDQLIKDLPDTNEELFQRVNPSVQSGDSVEAITPQ